MARGLFALFMDYFGLPFESFGECPVNKNFPSLGSLLL
jgi:hypothetical protein